MTFRKLFIFCFAVFFCFTRTIQAKELRFALPDHQVKYCLAQQGINLDDAWKELFDELGNLQEDKRSALQSNIEQAFNVCFDPCEINFPQSNDDVSKILRLFKLTTGKGVFSNDWEQALKNLDLLIKFLKQEQSCTIRAHCDSGTIYTKSLSQILSLAIRSYLTQSAIETRLSIDGVTTRQQIHINIMLIINTDTRIITLQTAPNQVQNGFTRVYTSDDINSWITEANS